MQIVDSGSRNDNRQWSFVCSVVKEQKSMVAVGTHLGSYKILSRIGAGGMGEVYRAKHLKLDRDVAIKVLPERFTKDSDALMRFEREAKALAVLSHPNILAIHDFSTDQEISFAVMELLEGETLRALLDRSALEWDKVIEISIAIAEGLSAAHSKGIIHRDLKPENIFITSDGAIKILDFGLAKLEKTVSKDRSSVSMRMEETQPGIVMGTPPYMSPEQLCGEPIDARSDIFSFGCVVYEMVIGDSPFSRFSDAEVMVAILKENPQKFSESGKAVPPEFERAVMRCLEKKPEDRFQSARELTNALRMISNDSKKITLSGPKTKTLSTPDRITSSDHGTLKFSRPTSRLRPRATIWITAALALILIVTTFSVFLLIGHGKTINSIAVLPLTNAGSDPNTEYLSDGITESIINSMSQLPKLRVMARSTVFSYKSRDVDPRKVGRELKVDAVLTGRVIQQGDQLIIKTELVNVADGSQLWAEQYSRKLSDVMAVQDDIAVQISEKLRMKLTGKETKRMTKHYTENAEAYQLYLKGRYYWNKRTPDGLKKGIEYFQQAIDMDPNYTRAYAGLADCYNLQSLYSGLPPKETFPRAKSAVTRALEIDKTLAEAHTSLGFVKYRFDLDWAGAEQEFKQANDLDPAYATAHQWYGLCLVAMGRFDEGLQELRRGEQIDPLSLILSSNVGRALYYARRYDQAIEQYQKTIELDPNFPTVRWFLGWAYEQKDEFSKAIAEYQKAITIAGNDTEAVAGLGRAYALSGKRGEAQKVLDELKERSKQEYISPHYMAEIYISLGEKDQAFEWLQKAYDDRTDFMVWLKVDPKVDSLRSDSRFSDLMRRVGL